MICFLTRGYYGGGYPGRRRPCPTESLKRGKVPLCLRRPPPQTERHLSPLEALRGARPPPPRIPAPVVPPRQKADHEEGIPVFPGPTGIPLSWCRGPPHESDWKLATKP